MIAEHENLPEGELELLATAALYHDIGFLHDAENHEQRGCEMARTELPLFGFTETQIESICAMIMATKLPQQPRTLAERIIADADLYYLGSENYERMSEALFEEMTHSNPDLSREEWKERQNEFFIHHRYHTSYCQEMLQPIKLANQYLLNNEAFKD
jgi:uncharacterized protein